jgi:hypothetical protein
MAYQITPPAHLIATANGRKFAVWGAVSSGMFSLGLFEYRADGWNGLWSSPLVDNAQLTADIAKAGGVQTWIEAIAEWVNGLLRKETSGSGVVPVVSGAPMFTDVLNELNVNWVLAVSDGVPRLQRKT